MSLSRNYRREHDCLCDVKKRSNSKLKNVFTCLFGLPSCSVDLFPETPLNAGVLSSPGVVDVAQWFEIYDDN